MALLILDNYDSFTYNLFHYCEQFHDNVEVRRNDAISIEEVDRFDQIILSPGPGLPDEAGIMPELIAHYYRSKHILGVCLGMQGIAEFFGAELINLGEVLHGKQSSCEVLGDVDLLYKNIPQHFKIGHYHSWVIAESSLPPAIQVSSKDDRGNVMSICHEEYSVRGVQFHPESILTEHGLEMIKNWIEGTAEALQQ